jgi:hypothetical protein
MRSSEANPLSYLKAVAAGSLDFARDDIDLKFLFVL